MVKSRRQKEEHDRQRNLGKIHRLESIMFEQREERLKVMDMLYKYKEAFSLRDEIGTCPNIEVDIEVTDRSPFLSDHIT